MSQPELCRVPFAAELSFLGEPETGQVAGYGAVFNNIDLNGDMLAPGSFDATLAEQKASGRVLPMFGEHSFAFVGGDPYPIGGWTKVEPDGKGLRVEGKLIGMGHPDVARVHELMMARLIPGLSIAFRPRDGGYVKGTKAGEPRRLLKAVDLFSIDVVGDPANPQALIDTVKSTMMMPNHQAAAQSIQDAHQMCADCMGGGDAPTKTERDQIMGHLKDAFRHLTGNDMPAAMMRFEQLRELKKWLHLPVDQGGRGFSPSQADEIAELVFKSVPRDESADAAAASAARKQVVGEIAGLLSDFSLKSWD